MNVNKKVRELYINNKYYFKYKRKKTKQNYWNKSKDPDGIIRYKISEKERKQFIKNNISLIKTIKFLNINNLIDIGCGAGYLLSALKKYKSFGVDNNSLALKQTSKYSKIEVAKQSLDDLLRLKEEFGMSVGTLINYPLCKKNKFGVCLLG